MPRNFTGEDALKQLQADRKPEMVEHRRQMALTNKLSAASIPQSAGGIADGAANPMGAAMRLYTDYVMTTSGNTMTCSPSESKIINVYVDSTVGWIPKTLEAAITLSTAGYTSGKNYDVFIYWDNSTDTFVLSTQIWTNDTTRAVALTTIDGARVLSTDETQRYLLTGRYNGTSLQVTSADNNGVTLWGTGDKYDPSGVDPVTGTIADQQGIRGFLAGVLQAYISSTGTIIGMAGGLVVDAAGFLLKLVGGATYISFTSTRALFGSDISAANTTAFSIFFTAQTYNTESVEAGSVLFGSNSATYANVLWRPSTKALEFRGGTTKKLYISTLGNLYIVNDQNIIFLDTGGLAKAGMSNNTSNDLQIQNNTTSAGVNIGITTADASTPALNWDEDPGNANVSQLTVNASTNGAKVQIGSGITIWSGKDATETVFNNDSKNIDFRIEGDTDANLFFSDASTDRIGIGNNTPAVKLDVTGAINASGAITGSNYNPGANVATFLETPSSANLSAMLTDETGSGAAVFAASPSLSTPTFTGVATGASLYLSGSIELKPPVTVGAATYTQLAADSYIIANRAGTVTITLLAAGSFSGHRLVIKTITANTVISASSNVVPLAGGAAGTAILAATAGKWVELISDGTNWVIMAGA